MGLNVLGPVLRFTREVGCCRALGMPLVGHLLISRLNRSICDERPFIEGLASFFCRKCFFGAFFVHSLL